MCFHNFTQHNGCGHFGESYTQPWTLCDSGLNRLTDLRGPNSPPLGKTQDRIASPKRTASTRRHFFSLGNTLSRSNTTGSTSTTSRRATSGPPGSPRDSTSRHGSSVAAQTSELDYATLSDHQLIAVRCVPPVKRTHVSREMDVCKTCRRFIDDMRSMLVRYDKTGSIRGTGAFERFLKGEGDGGGLGEDDLTVPLDDSVDGTNLGARQAVVMGLPLSEVGENGGGLEALVRELNQRRGFF